ncbi:MAG: co-chaperone GroES [Erysipelotrichaceae bacterium]|nr:co-chaperone GroES [Erysipelotrichaceae bacterium]
MLKPIGDKIVVKREEKNNTTESGILLAKDTKEKSRIATVVAVGKGRKCHDGSIQEIEVKVGDKVFLSHYAGDNDDVTYNGEELTIVDEGQILAVIE